MKKHTPRTITALTAKAMNIMSCGLEDLIYEIQPLFTALYLSHPSEAGRLLKMYPNSSEIRNLVDDALLHHTDMNRLKRIVDKGFFEFELRYLLQFSMDVPIAGTRLAPIFCTALEHAKELKLSDDLREDLKQFLEICKVRDGFVIVSATDEDLVLHFANDVSPE